MVWCLTLSGFKIPMIQSKLTIQMLVEFTHQKTGLDKKMLLECFKHQMECMERQFNEAKEDIHFPYIGNFKRNGSFYGRFRRESFNKTGDETDRGLQEADNQG